MLNSAELPIYINSLLSLNQNRASFSPYRERPPLRRFASVKGECLTTCNVPHACRPLYGEFLNACGGNPAVGLYTR